MRSHSLWLLLGVLVVHPAFSGGGALTGGATEVTQIANKIELIEQTIQQAEVLANTISKTYLDNVNYLKRLGRFPRAFASEVDELVGIVKQGQALAYSMENISEVFKQKYKGYEKSNNFQKDYKTWSDTTMDSIRTALAAANLQARDFEGEYAELQFWRNETQYGQSICRNSGCSIIDHGVGGHMAILQGANFIALNQVQQLKKLRHLMMAQAQAETSYLATKQQLKDNRHATMAEFFRKEDPRKGKTYEKY